MAPDGTGAETGDKALHEREALAGDHGLDGGVSSGLVVIDARGFLGRGPDELEVGKEGRGFSFELTEALDGQADDAPGLDVEISLPLVRVFRNGGEELLKVDGGRGEGDLGRSWLRTRACPRGQVPVLDAHLLGAAERAVDHQAIVRKQADSELPATRLALGAARAQEQSRALHSLWKIPTGGDRLGDAHQLRPLPQEVGR